MANTSVDGELDPSTLEEALVLIGTLRRQLQHADLQLAVVTAEREELLDAHAQSQAVLRAQRRTRTSELIAPQSPLISELRDEIAALQRDNARLGDILQATVDGVSNVSRTRARTRRSEPRFHPPPSSDGFYERAPPPHPLDPGARLLTLGRVNESLSPSEGRDAAPCRTESESPRSSLRTSPATHDMWRVVQPMLERSREREREQRRQRREAEISSRQEAIRQLLDEPKAESESNDLEEDDDNVPLMSSDGDVILCEDCHSPAEEWCRNEEAPYCTPCAVHLHARAAFRTHVIVPLSEMSTGEANARDLRRRAFRQRIEGLGQRKKSKAPIRQASAGKQSVAASVAHVPQQEGENPQIPTGEPQEVDTPKVWSAQAPRAVSTGREYAATPGRRVVSGMQWEAQPGSEDH